VRRCLVRAMYLSAFVVAMSTWGAISSVRPLPFLPEGSSVYSKLHYDCILSVCLSVRFVLCAVKSLRKFKSAGRSLLSFVFYYVIYATFE